jgi:hypothetical protein
MTRKKTRASLRSKYPLWNRELMSHPVLGDAEAASQLCCFLFYIHETFSMWFVCRDQARYSLHVISQCKHQSAHVEYDSLFHYDQIKQR